MGHPSTIPSPVTTTGDALRNGADISTLVMQLNRASATIHEMHMEANWLWSSLEATGVVIVVAD